MVVERGAVNHSKIVRAIPHNSKCRYGERGAADAVPQLPERCLSRKAGIVRCCLSLLRIGKYVMEHEADL